MKTFAGAGIQFTQSIGVNTSVVAEKAHKNLKIKRSPLRVVRWDTWLSAQGTWRCKPGSIEV